MNFLKITNFCYEQFKAFLEEKNVSSKTLRIYLSSITCHGPIFNIAVDEAKAEDIVQKVNDLTFILDKNLLIQYSGFTFLAPLENASDGFSLTPIFNPHKSECNCSSNCSSGCDGCSCED